MYLHTALVTAVYTGDTLARLYRVFPHHQTLHIPTWMARTGELERPETHELKTIQLLREGPSKVRHASRNLISPERVQSPPEVGQLFGGIQTNV